MRLIVCCLLFAVPVYGVSGMLVELLGIRHVHVALADRQASSTDPMAGWVDMRRSLPTQLPYHVHYHSGFERHHHDAGDLTVIALDGGLRQSAGYAGDSGAASSGAHVLAPDSSTAFLLSDLGRFAWPSHAASPVGLWTADPPDRPPKA